MIKTILVIVALLSINAALFALVNNLDDRQQAARQLVHLRDVNGH